MQTFFNFFIYFDLFILIYLCVHDVALRSVDNRELTFSTMWVPGVGQLVVLGGKDLNPLRRLPTCVFLTVSHEWYTQRSMELEVCGFSNLILILHCQFIIINISVCM